MDDMQLGISFWAAASGVDMVTAEIPSEIKGFLEWKVGEILVAESDDFALSHEECQLIFSGLSELAELHACHFGPDARGELLDLAAFWEEVLESGIGTFAVVYVLKLLPWGIFLAVIPGWKVLRVLGSSLSPFDIDLSLDIWSFFLTLFCFGLLFVRLFFSVSLGDRNEFCWVD